ncbi:hypothetical protein M900_1065 [Bacteriovorax sp. Seq25_V]|nr:hypothetical protein M900_1065 [Bacteriovorax sp. Seq25_V]
MSFSKSGKYPFDPKSMSLFIESYLFKKPSSINLLPPVTHKYLNLFLM